MKQVKGKTNWIDFLNPTEAEIKKLQKDFSLHDIIVKELGEPSARARAEVLGDYVYLIYYFPVYNEKERTSKHSEIDFIITKNTVITVHYEKIEPFEELKENKIYKADHVFELTYKIISSLLMFQDRQLRHIRENVEQIGEMLFKNRERKVLEEISHTKRNISEYRVIARDQGHLLNSLATHTGRFFGEESKVYIDDLVGDHLKIINQVEDYRAAISDFEDTNNQLMNIKINEVMKTFTIMSFMTFPFVLFLTIFDMNLASNPFHSMPFAFWPVVIVVVIGLIVMYRYFRNKKWL